MSKSIAQYMEVQLNPPPPPPKGNLSLLKKGNLIANGSEQILVEYNDIGRISGYVNLSEMEAGDEVKIRQYFKVNETYQKYADEEYLDIQVLPIIYFTPKETDNALKITLQQTAGSLKNYDNRFVLEEWSGFASFPTFTVKSDCPPGYKRIENLYWDPDTNEVVMQVGDEPI